MIRKSLLALGLLLGSHIAIAQALPEKYQEGVHYFKIDQAPARTDSNSIEVTEVFSYACTHCNTFDPFVLSWRERQPENVRFNRIHVSFGRREWELMARGYIAAEMMGIAEESHAAMMDAFWKQRKQFRNPEELAAFYAGFGVSPESFLANYKSFAADSQLRKSVRDVQVFGVNGTPSMVVNRKYRVGSSKDVPGFEAILDVVDFLIARETAAQAFASQPDS